MDIEEISVGQVVRIINWPEHAWGHRPDHWAEDGAMDEWCGAVVTISDIIEESGEIYIEDDEGEWQWWPSDFEHYHTLPPDDPNMQFKHHRHNILIDKLMALRTK